MYINLGMSTGFIKKTIKNNKECVCICVVECIYHETAVTQTWKFSDISRDITEELLHLSVLVENVVSSR